MEARKKAKTSRTNLNLTIISHSSCLHYTSMTFTHFIIQRTHKYIIRRYNYNYKIFKSAPTCFGSQRTQCLPIKWTTHTHNTQRVRICCHNTDHVHVNGHDRTILVILAKYCTRLPDDGSSVIRNMLEHFQIFYNCNCIYELYISALVD